MIKGNITIPIENNKFCKVNLYNDYAGNLTMVKSYTNEKGGVNEICMSKESWRVLLIVLDTVLHKEQIL